MCEKRERDDLLRVSTVLVSAKLDFWVIHGMCIRIRLGLKKAVEFGIGCLEIDLMVVIAFFFLNLLYLYEI